MEKEKVQVYKEHLQNVNCYVAPTQKIDSGSYGKKFEIDVKLFLNGRIATKNAIASKGKIDLTFHGKKIECKSGCGTLDGIMKNDFVIYSPTSELNNARVYTPQEFMNILNACNLVRVKKTTSGQVVSAIQTFKNSQKKQALFTSMLNNYGIALKDFKANY